MHGRTERRKKSNFSFGLRQMLPTFVGRCRLDGLLRRAVSRRLLVSPPPPLRSGGRFFGEGNVM